MDALRRRRPGPRRVATSRPVGPALAVALLPLLAVVLAGCLAAGQACTNRPDAYRCDFGGSGEFVREERWETTGERANVTVHMGGLGTVNVTLWDADGTRVLNASFEVAGGASETRISEPGTPGRWTVRLEVAYRGGMDLVVEPAA